MVRLQAVDATLRAGVLALEPGPGQAPYSGVPTDTLPAAERHRTRHPVAILRDGQVVGFFALDPADAICAYAPPGAHALRAFLVGARYQRQGVAAAALRALPGYLLRRDPTATGVVLTVGIRNRPARAAYLAAGFAPTGRLHAGGASGMEDVLLLELYPPAGF